MARRTFTVPVRRYTPEAGLDRYRNPVPGYVDGELEVYTYEPRTSVEETEGGARTAVITGLRLYAVEGAVVGPKDRVVLEGEEWAVDGEAGRYGPNPSGFGMVPRGVLIELTRSTG